MAHWAELDENNIVLRITVGDNDDPDEGYQWLINNLGGKWVKTSYTSRGGNRINPDTGEIVSENDHFRFNYAGEGYYYDEQRDAFIPPKPFNSWILNEQSCLWQAPIPRPDFSPNWIWDEDNVQWISIAPPVL